MGKISVKGFQYDRLFIPGNDIQREYADDVCTGYSFVIRYPSYRGTFLSCIESLTLEVDGKPIPEEDMRFCLNGKEFVISELKDMHREYWFVLADARLRVVGQELSDGEHTVKVTMYHRIPYTGYFGQYLIWDNVGEKTLTVK
jgi:hypothetical protein